MEFTYTKEDFLTTAPYEEVLKIEDPFQQNIFTQKLNEHAASVKFRGFKKALRDYRESQKRALQAIREPDTNITDFEQSELELNTGEWVANEYGVYRYGVNGPEYACTHPIYPCERLRNIDTNEMKLTIAYKRGLKNRNLWNYQTIDYDMAMNAKNIVSLAKLGISVTSGKRAQNLVDYLADIIDLNYDFIPERKSVSRLGWNEEGFSPYIGDIVFDGHDQFGRMFDAVKPHGNLEDWLEEVKRVRKYSLTARIVLASSFASVLVGPMGCVPFFVHLWGMASETGKTVAQMVAASVWAEPTRGGDYFKTFKATSVGFEVMAGFLRSLPLVIDELQLSKDARGKMIFNVYELESGSGKMRSNKTLGIAATARWENCFITSGETPITNEQDGAGALNRVIEIECLSENKVIENGHRTAECMKKNYGHAGKMFVELLCEDGVMDIAKKRYSELFEEYTSMKATEKQSHSAALITLADEIATSYIFKDDLEIKTSELAEFLKSKEAISAADRGYDYICDWVAMNANKFRPDSEIGDIYGVLGSVETADAGYAYIIRSVFNKACADMGISHRALLSQLRTKGLIETRGRAFTVDKRLSKEVRAECVKLNLNGGVAEDCGTTAEL